jgi:hypothetical protein
MLPGSTVTPPRGLRGEGAGAVHPELWAGGGEERGGEGGRRIRRGLKQEEGQVMHSTGRTTAMRDASMNISQLSSRLGRGG